MTNSKSEYRNLKRIPNTNYQNLKEPKRLHERIFSLILFVQFFPNALRKCRFKPGELFNDAENIGQILLPRRRRAFPPFLIHIRPNFALRTFSSDNFALISRLRLTSSSAASTASLRCTSGGTRTINFPLYRREQIGSGTCSPPAFISLTTPATVLRIPRRASSGVGANQLKLGNSAHRPTHWASSSDQTTRYV
jgi:hypothetical protein